MDTDSQAISHEISQSTARDLVDSGSVIDHSVQLMSCTLCRRILLPDNEVTGDLETIRICGDCKFLFLEDHGTLAQDSHRRRPPRGRTARYSSSESIENLFSQQFAHMINLARQNQYTASGHEDQLIDDDVAASLLQRTSSRTTPSGSRRWRRVLSDTESDGFDNLDSLYGESDSNVSFGRYRVSHGESDTVSFSAYGGDSDASSFLDMDMFMPPDEGSNLDSDTDIDPMHAGLNQWNSDDPEEEGEEEDGEWDEVDAEEDTVDSMEAGAQLRNIFMSRPIENNGPVDRHQQFHSPEFEGNVRRRTREGRQRYSRNIFANLEDSDLPPVVQNSGDYLDARGFEELLEHLAETDSSRRGTPPAAMSFVNNLPRIVIGEEHEKHGSSVCAICKDVLIVGTVVNQLPCFHLYHPYCIFPWLSTRNSCPLCRYELPTDDKDYEEGKQNMSGRMEIHEIQQQDESEDRSSDVSDEVEAIEEHQFSQGRTDETQLLDVDPAVIRSGREDGRGRWFFLAAAPIVSLVGIVLVLWLGNPLVERRGLAGQCNIPAQALDQVSGSSQFNQRESRSRRWWSLF